MFYLLKILEHTFADNLKYMQEIRKIYNITWNMEKIIRYLVALVKYQEVKLERLVGWWPMQFIRRTHLSSMKFCF